MADLRLDFASVLETDFGFEPAEAERASDLLVEVAMKSHDPLINYRARSAWLLAITEEAERLLGERRSGAARVVLRQALELERA